jgi:hypothetical protein
MHTHTHTCMCNANLQTAVALVDVMLLPAGDSDAECWFPAEQGSAYWASWAITNFSIMAASGVLCAGIALYPFSHSSFSLLLCFYWLVAATLIAFAYFMSTLFSRSRVAGSATATLFVVSMVPG